MSPWALGGILYLIPWLGHCGDVVVACGMPYGGAGGSGIGCWVLQLFLGGGDNVIGWALAGASLEHSCIVVHGRSLRTLLVLFYL